MSAFNVCRADASEFVAHSHWRTTALTEAGATALAGPYQTRNMLRFL